MNHRPWIEHLVAARQHRRLPALRDELRDRPDLVRVKGVKAAMQRVDAKGCRCSRSAIARRRPRASSTARSRPAERRCRCRTRSWPSSRAGQGDERRIVPLTASTQDARCCVQIGEDDKVVDGGGARFLLGRLQAAGFPARRVQTDVVRSQNGLRPTTSRRSQTTPAAQAEFWAPPTACSSDLRFARHARRDADHRRQPEGPHDPRAEGARHPADVRPGARGRVQPDRPGRRRARARPVRRLGRDGARGALARRLAGGLRRVGPRGVPRRSSGTSTSCG